MSTPSERGICQQLLYTLYVHAISQASNAWHRHWTGCGATLLHGAPRTRRRAQRTAATSARTSRRTSRTTSSATVRAEPCTCMHAWRCRCLPGWLPPGPSPLFVCAVWVFCGNQSACQGNYGQCWLKHLAHPEASKPAKQGPHVPWTAGTLDVDINANPGGGAKSDKKVRGEGPTRSMLFGMKLHSSICISPMSMRPCPIKNTCGGTAPR